MLTLVRCQHQIPNQYKVEVFKPKEKWSICRDLGQNLGQPEKQGRKTFAAKVSRRQPCYKK